MITCKSEERDGVTVVSPVGSLDETNLSSLEQVLSRATEHDTVLDLSRVAYLNSQVLSLAVYSWRNATRSGRRFILANASAPIRQVLEASGLDQLIPVSDSLEHALTPRGDDNSLAHAASALTVDSMPELFHIRQRLQDLAAGSSPDAVVARSIPAILARLDGIVFDRPKNADEELKELKAELLGLDEVLAASAAAVTAAGADSADAKETSAGASVATADLPSAPQGEPLVDEPAFLASGLDAELLAEGVAESRDHLERAEESLLKLETSPGDRELLNEIFRAFHSIKGFAGFVGARRLAHLAHVAETLLDHARNGFIQVSGLTADIILQSIDSLRRMLDALQGHHSWTEAEADRRVREYLEAHAVVHQSGVQRPVSSDQAIATEVALTDQEDVSAALPPIVKALEDRRSAVEETSTAASPSSRDTGDPGVGRREASGDASMRVSIERVDHMVNMVGELVIAQAMLHEDREVVASLESNSALHRRVAEVAKVTRELQDIAMSLRMVPLTGTFQRLARVVRDTSRRLGKDVRFDARGEETEIDRSMVESIVDPLVHMIRNSLDHGLEEPASRTAAGKPTAGTIRIAAEHEGGYVVIRVEDDGRGIDPDRILEKAREKGLVPPDQEMDREQVLDLLFLPGFSTAAAVTDLSGRGVGMDVVKTNIERMGGDVRLESRLGDGTTVTVRVPLTMAIIDGMLVRVGEISYTIPLLSIRESFAVTARQVTTTAEGNEVVRIRDRIYPVARLHRLHGVPSKVEALTDGILILLENKGVEFCLFVDTIVGQQQTVVKGLSRYLGRVRGVTSCAIMGNGEISLILDVSGVYEMALGERESARERTQAVGA